MSQWHSVSLAQCTLAVPVVVEGAGPVVSGPCGAPVCLSQQLAAVEGREGGGGLATVAGTLRVVPHVFLQLGPQQVPLLGAGVRQGRAGDRTTGAGCTSTHLHLDTCVLSTDA